MLVVPVISGVRGASWSSRMVTSLAPGFRKWPERNSERAPPRSQKRPRLWPLTQTMPNEKFRRSRNVLGNSFCPVASGMLKVA